jgi:hypothetical protein
VHPRPAKLDRVKSLAIAAVLLGAVILLLVFLNSHTEKFHDDRVTLLATFPYFAKSLCFERATNALMIVHHGKIDVRSMDDQSQITKEIPMEFIECLAADNEGRFGYCGTMMGRVIGVNLQTMQVLQEKQLDLGPVSDLAVSWEKQVVVASNPGMHLAIVDLAKDKIRLPQKTPSEPIRSVTISSDGMYLAIVHGFSGTNDVFAVENTSNLDRATVKVPQANVLSTAFCGSSHVLAVGLYVYGHPNGEITGGVRFWDCDSKQEIGTHEVGSGGGIYSIVSSEDGQIMVFGDEESSIYVCRRDPWQVIQRFDAFKGARVAKIAISPDKQFLAAACDDLGGDDRRGHAQVKVWSLGDLLKTRDK